MPPVTIRPAMNNAFDSCSDKSSHPKNIPIMGVKKEKLATVVAE
jgi:hypothetical protein